MKQDRQIQLTMTALAEYLREDLVEYWDNEEPSNHIGEIIIHLDKLVNKGRATERIARELEYFDDHRRSLNQYIDSGR